MNDVFPPANLPPESMPWARAVESRVYQAENANETVDQSISGLNRNTATNLTGLSKQFQELNTQVTRVQALYDSLPLVSQKTQVFRNFGLSSSSWNNIGSISFTAPKTGSFVISVTASGQLVSGSTSTNMECDFRLSAGSTSPTVPGVYDSPDGTWRNNFLLTWGWTLPVTVDTPVTVTLQADPTTTASWGANTGSYAVLSGFGTFLPA